jgi:hypothetical protein
MRKLVLVVLTLLVGALPSEGQTPVPSPAAPAANPSPAPASAALSKIDPVKAGDIQRLMDVAGMRKILTDTMTGMLVNVRPTLEKNLPPGAYRDQLIDLFLERLKTKMNVQQFIDLGFEAYDKYLSDDEINALTAFYQTPVGPKTLTTLPQMLVELQSKGRQIGEKAGRDAMNEVLTEHPDLAKAIQDGAAKQ